MKENSSQKPVYGSWVSDGRIRQTSMMCGLFALLTVAFALLAALAGQGAWAYALGAVCLVLAALFFVSAKYFVRAQRLFAPEGGDVQGKVVGLVLDKIHWDGRGEALDIGCGSGALAIQLAKRYPDAQVSAIDYWGGSWGYFQQQCEENARLEGVPGRIAFSRASASKLPFADGTFDLTVSNLVFHEVADVKDKRDCIREALRVLKPGGRFVFQDLFLIERYYGKPEELVAFVKSCGASEALFADTSKSAFIPKALRLPFMVGTLGMLIGMK